MQAERNFNVVAAPGTGLVPHPRVGLVPAEGMSDKRALLLWRSGSAHVTITRQGARALLRDLPTVEQVALLKVCKTAAECDALGALSNAEELAQAVAARKVELRKGRKKNAEAEPARQEPAQQQPPTPSDEQLREQQPDHRGNNSPAPIDPGTEAQ